MKPSFKKDLLVIFSTLLLKHSLEAKIIPSVDKLFHWLYKYIISLSSYLINTTFSNIEC